MTLHLPDPTERDDLGAFTARVVRLDAGARVVLRGSRGPDGDRVTAWAPTPFDALATRSVRGTLGPAELAIRVQAWIATGSSSPAPSCRS